MTGLGPVADGLRDVNAAEDDLESPFKGFVGTGRLLFGLVIITGTGAAESGCEVLMTGFGTGPLNAGSMTMAMGDRISAAADASVMSFGEDTLGSGAGRSIDSG